MDRRPWFSISSLRIGRNLARFKSPRQFLRRTMVTYRGGGIELLGDGHERDAVAVEDLDHFREVRERTGQAVDFIDHDYVDELFADVG